MLCGPLLLNFILRRLTWEGRKYNVSIADAFWFYFHPGLGHLFSEKYEALFYKQNNVYLFVTPYLSQQNSTRKKKIKIASVLFVLNPNIPGHFHNQVFFLAKKQPIGPYFAMVI